MKILFLDAIERVIISVFAINFFSNFINVTTIHPHYILLLAGEALGLAFVLFRPWGQPMATSPYAITVGVLGTIFPLLVSPIGYRPELATIGGSVMAVGILLAITGKVALNRRFGMVAANRGVQSRGPYSLIRHPIYAGYTITHIGFILTNPALWNVMIYVSALMLQMLRIIIEERFLMTDPDYQLYSKAVRYRLLPGIF